MGGLGRESAPAVKLLVAVCAFALSLQMAAGSVFPLEATFTSYNGSAGGACGYGDLSKTEHGFLNFAASLPLFENGAACGQCYNVKCTDAKVCARSTITVRLTDSCTGSSLCSGSNVAIALSGYAFDKLALPGKVAALRKIGTVKAIAARVRCAFHGNVGLEVGSGFNPYYLPLLVRNANGGGSISTVAIQTEENGPWKKLTRDWGANFVLNGQGAVSGPITVRITSSTGVTITCPKQLPKDFKAGVAYDCGAQFPAKL